MKKYIVVILCLAIVIFASGCTTYSQHTSPKDPINFYYCTQSSDHSKAASLIGTESREALAHRDDPEYLLSLYLSGPISYQFSSPFPAGVSLQGLSIKDGNADITLSSHISKLSDFDATLAFACLFMTVDEMLQIDSVTIRAKDALINDNPSITLYADSFAFETMP